MTQRTNILLVANRTAQTTRLRLDLPSKARGLGLPVTHVEAGSLDARAA